jgi:hypothetical protein
VVWKVADLLGFWGISDVVEKLCLFFVFGRIFMARLSFICSTGRSLRFRPRVAGTVTG